MAASLQVAIPDNEFFSWLDSVAPAGDDAFVVEQAPARPVIPTKQAETRYGVTLWNVSLTYAAHRGNFLRDPYVTFCEVPAASAEAAEAHWRDRTALAGFSDEVFA